MIPKYRAYINERVGMVFVKRICFYPPFIDFEWENENGITQTYSEDLDKVKLMQSTGLKDKNGVEIFEGDIIKNIYGDYSAIGIGKYAREHREEFDNHPTIYNPIGVYECIFDYSTGGKSSYEFEFDSNNAENIEVIGNIYENYELLEVAE